jgi:hypothetical protein
MLVLLYQTWVTMTAPSAEEKSTPTARAEE